MPRINFVVARTDEEAQGLANEGGMGCGTLPEARNIRKTLQALQSTAPVQLAPSGDYHIYAVRHEVKRLSDDVGDA